MFSQSSAPRHRPKLILMWPFEEIAQNLPAIALFLPFSTINVKNALFQMGPFETHTRNGLSTFFYQKYWKVIETEVTLAGLGILNEGHYLEGWNYTIIILIPKVVDPILM